MCGIFGAVGALPAGALERVSQSIAHRGPDAAGIEVVGACSLVHRRLKIIDLSDAAAQPMPNEDRSVWTVFNGEIYNHKQLRAELEQAGHVFRSRSDTEVLVHGYEAWGDALVERLSGMFAFAIWDAKRERLLVARDRCGKKPIFYSHTDGVVRFASEPKALFASGLAARFDPTTLPEFLVHGFVAPPRFFHEHVRRLEPGSYFVVDKGGSPRVETYWRPRFARPRPVRPYEGTRLELRDHVIDAVARRLESDVPLGAFLSGGIDSTIIVGVMSRILGLKVRTFSIGFAGDPRFDETSYARIAARAFDTVHTEFTLEPSSFDLVEKLVRFHDGPFGDSSAIPTYVLAGLTRQHVTVALTGDGGDELFCGYQRFLAAEAAEALPVAVRRLAGAVARMLPSENERSLVARARRFATAAHRELPDRLLGWLSLFPDPRAVLRPEVARALGDAVDEPVRRQQRFFADSEARSTLGKVLEHNFSTYLPFDLLVKADRMSMAHGLELRSPFLDAALVEFAAGLPPQYLRRGTLTKRILKDAFADILPTEIRTRGKMGFGIPLGTWFRTDLRSYLGDLLGPGARIDAWLDRAAVDRLLDQHWRGVADHGHRLWALLTLEVWMRSVARAEIADCPVEKAVATA